jgi:hypothetical protein
MDTNIIDTYKSIYIYSLLSIKIRFNIINDDICKDKPELLDEFNKMKDNAQYIWKSEIQYIRYISMTCFANDIWHFAKINKDIIPYRIRMHEYDQDKSATSTISIQLHNKALTIFNGVLEGKCTKSKYIIQFFNKFIENIILIVQNISYSSEYMEDSKRSLSFVVWCSEYALLTTTSITEFAAMDCYNTICELSKQASNMVQSAGNAARYIETVIEYIIDIFTHLDTIITDEDKKSMIKNSINRLKIRLTNVHTFSLFAYNAAKSIYSRPELTMDINTLAPFIFSSLSETNNILLNLPNVILEIYKLLIEGYSYLELISNINF